MKGSAREQENGAAFVAGSIERPSLGFGRDVGAFSDQNLHTVRSFAVCGMVKRGLLDFVPRFNFGPRLDQLLDAVGVVSGSRPNKRGPSVRVPSCDRRASPDQRLEAVEVAKFRRSVERGALSPGVLRVWVGVQGQQPLDLAQVARAEKCSHLTRRKISKIGRTKMRRRARGRVPPGSAPWPPPLSTLLVAFRRRARLGTPFVSFWVY